jgi:hypothetical protein
MYMGANVCAPIYEHGMKLRGMQDHRGVRSIIRNILIPALGSKLIDGIVYDDLRRLRDERLAAPRLRGGKKIVPSKGTRSIARVNREMSVARAIFNYAINDLGILQRNPCRAGRGRSIVVLAAETPRDRVLSLDEEKRMLAKYPKRSADYFITHSTPGFALRRCSRSPRRRPSRSSVEWPQSLHVAMLI